MFKLKFNNDFDGFTAHEEILGFETPQVYLRQNPDIDQHYLFVQIRGQEIYMVVYRPTAAAIATHPWARLSWVKDLSPWGDNSQVWIQNVEAYLRRQGLL